MFTYPRRFLPALIMFLLPTVALGGTFIFNGENAPRQPEMVRISSFGGMCGGTLIANQRVITVTPANGATPPVTTTIATSRSNAVLTAWHCLEEEGYTEEQIVTSMKVRICEYDTSQIDGCERVITATKLIPVAGHDMALIILAETLTPVISGTETVVDFVKLENIAPVMGEPVQLYGWGHQGEQAGEQRNPILQTGTMTITEVFEKYFCAKGKTLAGSGDSGGPAKNSAGQQIGVISSGSANRTCFGAIDYAYQRILNAILANQEPEPVVHHLYIPTAAR